MRMVEPRIFHVTSRGNAQETIHRDREDYTTFLRMAAAVIAEFGWRCEAYCLMPNHFHFVLDIPEPNLDRGMHRLKGRYARRFNVRHGRLGHVFQGPYDAKPIRSDEQLLVCWRYVDLNPVRAGLCADPAEWLWSSYRAQAGLNPPPTCLERRRIHALAGGPAGFRAFVLGGIDDCNPAEARLRLAK